MAGSEMEMSGSFIGDPGVGGDAQAEVTVNVVECGSENNGSKRMKRLCRNRNSEACLKIESPGKAGLLVAIEPGRRLRNLLWNIGGNVAVPESCWRCAGSCPPGNEGLENARNKPGAEKRKMVGQELIRPSKTANCPELPGWKWKLVAVEGWKAAVL